MVVGNRLRGIRATAVITSLVGCLLLVGCSSAAQGGSGSVATPALNQTDLYEVIFDKTLINLMGFEDAADIVESSTKDGDYGTPEDVFMDCFARDDGTVVVTYTAAQLEDQKQWLKKRIAIDLEAHDEVEGRGKLELSSDYKTLNIYMLTRTALDAIPGWGGALYNGQWVTLYSAWMQILEHPGDPSWDVTWNIYNAESGKLVVTGSWQEGIVMYDEQTWAASQ